MPIPFSNPPKKPDGNWWKTIPGQLSILLIAGAVVFIFCGISGRLD